MPDKASTVDPQQLIAIRSFEAGDEQAFRALNEEWIGRYFTLESKDRETLENPWGAIIGKGGCIFMVVSGAERVGCAALIPMANGVYELSKMAIAPELRGRGFGRQLLLHVIAEARALGARGLFLGSSTKLANAVRLYESVGFKHVSPEAAGAGYYARADVWMAMDFCK